MVLRLTSTIPQQGLLPALVLLLLLVSDLELPDPVVFLPLALFDIDGLVVLFPLRPIALPVCRATHHGENRETLGVYTTPEHAICLVFVASSGQLSQYTSIVSKHECEHPLYRLCRLKQRPAGQGTAKRDKRFLEESSLKLLPSALFVEISAATCQTWSSSDQLADQGTR